MISQIEKRRSLFANGGEMAARMQAFDWSKSSLGPAESWPQSLRTAIRIMLTSKFAMWMALGPELIFFCNDAYLPTVGLKRDWVLGARSDKVWEEIWPDIGPRIGSVLNTGQATWDESPAAVSGTLRLSRRNLPYVFIQPARRRRRPNHRHAVRRHGNHRQDHRRAPVGNAARSWCPPCWYPHPKRRSRSIDCVNRRADARFAVFANLPVG